MLASAAIHPNAVSSCPRAVAPCKRRFLEQRTRDFLENLLGDLGGDLVLGDSVWVRQSIVCNVC
jgi:hypothetical protein